jgi:AraC-like DNA-binding protein
MLFSEHLGISPKALATILRFQKFYKVLSAMNSDYLKNEIYDLYYDESHFVKEFKRYTGFSPTRFAVLPNDFGKNF